MDYEEIKLIHDLEERPLTLEEAKKALEENLGRDWNTGELYRCIK